jgi:2-keto-3-deoxy-L-rhamnonate aldolase RhmA
VEIIRPNRMKRKLEQKHPVFDVRISIPDPELVEIAGTAGLDAIWIDAEHANLNWERALACVLAAELHGITPILRPTALPGYREYMIQRALDLGFQGVWVTGVNNPEEMQAILNVIKFPPQGKRGVGEGRVLERAGERVSQGPEVLQALNAEIFVAIMVESTEAVATIDDICALEGVDAAGLGHRDYALDAGLPDFSLEQPGMKEAIGKINAAAKKHGKAWSGGAATPENVKRAMSEGALIFSLGRETRIWANTCNSIHRLKDELGL